MRLTPLLLAALLALPAPLVLAAEPAIIYLTRHGEKASDGKDPALTDKGQAIRCGGSCGVGRLACCCCPWWRCSSPRK